MKHPLSRIEGSNKPQTIDLDPLEWSSDRPRPHEPVFQPGGIAVLAGIAASAIFCQLGTAFVLEPMFGELFAVRRPAVVAPAPKPTLAVGETVRIGNVTITRLD